MLTRKHTLLYAAIGLALWFAAALAVRFGGAMLAEDSAWLVYLLTLPAVWGGTALIQRMVGSTRSELVAGVSLGTAAAAFCDGVALRWFSELYGPHFGLGGAWILWGAAAFLASSFLAPAAADRKT
jgi:hypothetical protein